jgi:hypothetical protein
MLSLMPEEGIVSILAHELGHYYRPHISSGDVNYNFVYDASTFNPPSRAVAKEGTEEIKQFGQANRARYEIARSRFKNLLQNIPATAIVKVDGMGLHPVTFAAAAQLVTFYQTDLTTSCSTVSADLKMAGQAELFEIPGIALPLSALNEKQSQILVELERETLACLEGVRLDDELATPLPVDAVEAATNMFPLVRKAASPAPTSGTLKDWVLAMDHKVRESYEKEAIEPATDFSVTNIVAALKGIYVEKAISKKVAAAFETEKLGLYTTEQEADELAAEWMHALKFHSSIPGSVDLVLLKMFNGENEYNACKEKRDRGWKNDDGSAIFVTWNNDHMDPHPEACFRVRDQDLEASAHGYDLSDSTAKNISDQKNWVYLIKSMPTASEVAAKQRKKLAEGIKRSHQFVGAFKDAHGLGCRFDH